MGEEYNNFLQKVTEVSKIVKNLTINDTKLNEAAMIEADKYLNSHNAEPLLSTKDENPNLKIISDRTIINKINETSVNEGEMSQEAFMREVERDAKKRFEDKRIRKEKCSTFKTRANKAYTRGEYEKALSCYNNAIELIRDDSNLYNNRAVTYMKLNFYERAIKDCETAIKIKENSLRAWLYMAKCYFQLENEEKSKECVKEALERNPNSKSDIEAYVDDFKRSSKPT